jgi:hypothetical protein
MPDDGDNARLGSPRSSPWPGGRPGLFPLRRCGRLVDTGLQAIGSLAGTLPRASFCLSSVTASVCDWALLAVMLPVQPINAFGKHQPMPRNVFERLFEV